MTTPKTDEHINAAQLAIVANKLCSAADARKWQAEHARRTIAIGRTRNGEPFVIVAEPEPTATEVQDVTVI
jgi:hypothetical protein